MMQAVPVYIEFASGLDHDAIERELDAQMGLAPRPPRWKRSAVQVCCEHGRIERVQLKGRAVVTCRDCEHEWYEMGLE